MLTLAACSKKVGTGPCLPLSYVTFSLTNAEKPFGNWDTDWWSFEIEILSHLTSGAQQSWGSFLLWTPVAVSWGGAHFRLFCIELQLMIIFNYGWIDCLFSHLTNRQSNRPLHIWICCGHEMASYGWCLNLKTRDELILSMIKINMPGSLSNLIFIKNIEMH